MAIEQDNDVSDDCQASNAPNMCFVLLAESTFSSDGID